MQPYIGAKKSDTDKKLLHDVLRRGDTLFSTGDIMSIDEHGWLYFEESVSLIQPR